MGGGHGGAGPVGRPCDELVRKREKVRARDRRDNRVLSATFVNEFRFGVNVWGARTRAEWAEKARKAEEEAQRWLAPLGRPSPLLHSMYYLSSLPD